ncbi:MAG: NAD(P)-dependent oxidoreductase [Bacilli bacterium]|nr:NAD(P)-dependent oxidoreductase [Bacillales bacterium]MDY2575202.1 NAD(P)-dependent oxidoreductase [Bacilli bacterium]
MERKIICFGVRDYEKPYFEELGKKYNYELVLKSQFLNTENYKDALGYEIVMVRGNCVVNYEAMKDLADHGLKYYLTRTAGFNHVDLKACKDFHIESAYVPGYSPNSISELALTLAMMLLRNTGYTTDLTHRGQFKVTNQMFSREVRGCTVGILGCGRIGCTSAKLFKGLGARVVGYDVYQSDYAKEVVEFLPLEKFIAESDIILVHLAYIPGKNDHFIDKDFISKMKDQSILVNVARGEVLDLQAAVEAIKSNHLAGLAIDVIEQEKTIFFKNFDDPKHMDTPLHQDLIDLYPKVLVTPHVASSTDKALIDMIEVSLKNMDEYLLTGKCKNSLIK